MPHMRKLINRGAIIGKNDFVDIPDPGKNQTSVSKNEAWYFKRFDQSTVKHLLFYFKQLSCK